MSVQHAIFHELLRRHQDAVFSYAMFLLRNRADAEDVTQEAMLRMWRHLGGVRPIKTRAWIMRVTHNLCVDIIRRREATPGGVPCATPEHLEAAEIPQDGRDPAIAADQAILRSRISAAIQTLPDQQRSVFVLNQLQGLTCRRVTRVLDMPVNTVKVSLLRARIHLRKELKDYGPHA